MNALIEQDLSALGITVEEKPDCVYYRCPSLFGAAPTAIVVTVFRPTARLPYAQFSWMAGLWATMPDRTPGTRHGLRHVAVLHAALEHAIATGRRFEAEWAAVQDKGG